MRLPRATATKIDDTHVDLAATQTWGLVKGGSRVAIEVAVSKAKLNWLDGYIVCIRDITERHLAEVSVRESEGRYRTLVEHAPEAIVVFDVDGGKFVDVNDNACRFFKMSRAELLGSGPDKISPALQADGTPSFGVARGYIDSALAGEVPVFEWVHCDSAGQNFPCEVRFVRLPSSNRRLIRASIIDITERKRADAIASGERRVFEKIAANAPLNAALEAICELIERAMPESCCAINLLDRDRQALSFGVAPNLPREFVQAMDYAPIGIRFGSCSAAVYLSRLVTVADIESDALWEYRRDAARAGGIQGRLVRAHRGIGRPSGGHFCRVPRARSAFPRHAITSSWCAWRRSPASPLNAARGRRPAQQRIEVSRPVRERHGGRLSNDARRPHSRRQPGLREFAGLFLSRRTVSKCPPALCTGTPTIGRISRGAPRSRANCATKNT